MADKYLLRVTAGPDYDTSKHTLVSVNTPHPTKISSALGSALISVRIQNYHGKAPFPSRFLFPLRQPYISTGPPPSSPVTSPYFSHPAHTHDQYSISFVICPNAAIPGSSLVFGNDFSYPIRDRLPPGFNTALHIVKWAIDPGLDGDVYSDTPYLYGNALSSLNTLRVMGSGDDLEGWDGELERGLEEGGERGGEVVRREIGVPEEAQARKKWFLEKGKTDKWVWEKGTVYGADFFNPYLDFNGSIHSSMPIQFPFSFPPSFLLPLSLEHAKLFNLTLCNFTRLLPQTSRLLSLDPEIPNGRGLSTVSTPAFLCRCSVAPWSSLITVFFSSHTNPTATFSKTKTRAKYFSLFSSPLCRGGILRTPPTMIAILKWKPKEEKVKVEIGKIRSSEKRMPPSKQ